jgi:hypothetical protein
MRFFELLQEPADRGVAAGESVVADSEPGGSWFPGYPFPTSPLPAPRREINRTVGGLVCLLGWKKVASYAAILLFSYKPVTLLRIFFGSKPKVSQIHLNAPIFVSSLKNHAFALSISSCFLTLELSPLTCPFIQQWNASSNTADHSYFSGERGSHRWLFVLAQNCTG